MAWTANTIVKYQADATAIAGQLRRARQQRDAPTAPTRSIFHYDAAVDPNLVLSNISSLYILPEHVWGKYVGNDGKDLKTFRPENNLPLVSGGPFQITKYSKKGTTVFKPNPGYWGAPPHVEAVGLVYYTNSDSMIADLQGGTIDAVDQVPYTAVERASRRPAGWTSSSYKYGEFTNITWNSNPRKPKNRELLDPQVKKALSMCVDRQQIISVIYAGNATLANQSVIGPFGICLAEPGRLRSSRSTAPRATPMLDQLGYKKGADGIRIAPATTGKYAQPAHPMQYQIMVPNSLDFNGSREFSIVQDGFMNARREGDPAGRRRLRRCGRDRVRQQLQRGQGHRLRQLRHRPVGLVLVHRSGLPAVGADAATSGAPGTTRATTTPSYNAMYKQEGISAGDATQDAGAKMDKLISDQYIYTFLVNEEAISASRPNWAGYHPELNGYNSGYMTEPYQK